MAPAPIAASGREYLALATTLLQTCRLDDPTAGLWEAADLQWWWRRDQHPDPRRAQFWLDRDGAPVAAAIVTDWGEYAGLDVIARASAAALLDDVWAIAVDVLAHESRRVEMLVRDDDTDTARRARGAGFVRAADSGFNNWMAAGARPAPEPLPAGYRLVSFAERPGTRHWLVERSGEHVAARLAECSLYRPDLDLAVVTDDDEIAAYGLFWPDLLTGVGLVEPMRTEAAHQRRGLARRVLLAGLDRLAAAGCTRLKIGFMADNPASKACYLGAGFEPLASDSTWELPSHP